jgi:TetR/AcrR family transcriptional regulator
MTGTDQIDASTDPTTTVDGDNPEPAESSDEGRRKRRTTEQVLQERRQTLEARREERKRRREEREKIREERRAARKAEREEKKASRKTTRSASTSTKKSTRGRTKKTKGGRKKRDPERTKARILSAATDLFTKCGLNGTSLDDISKEAGVNRGLIYHYFKTKEFLFDQVLARPLAEYVQSHLEFLQYSEIDADALREATRGFFYFLREHPEMVRLIAWTLAMRRITPDLAQLQFTRALYERAVTRIEEAKERGTIREGVDAQHLLITIIDLCVSWHLSRAEWVEKLSWQDRDSDELDEERLHAILDLVEAGIRPLPPGVEA